MATQYNEGHKATTSKVPTNKMSKPGDVIIEEITIKSYTGFTVSVRGQFVSLTIYEDIYNNTLSGQLMLNDALALLKHTPIVGNETVTVSFYTPGDIAGDTPRKLKFRLFNVSAMTKTTTDNSKFLVLELVSDEFQSGTTKRFSRSLSKMRYSDMARTIFKDHVLPPESDLKLRIDTTMGFKNLVIPFWTPFYAMNWIAKRSVSAYDQNDCDYLFFQTLDGYYNFKSLATLKSTDSKATYTQVPAGQRVERTGEQPIESYLRNIKNLVVVQMPDRLKQIATGTLASSLLTFDITKKEWRRRVYDYGTEFYKETHLSTHPIISTLNEDTFSLVNSHVKFYPKHSYQFNGYPNNDNVETYALKRQALMNQMSNQILRLAVPGDSRITVGDTIDVEIPAFEETKNKDEYLDTLLSGKYMITSISHVIQDDQYDMEMLISRDSFYKDLPDFKDQALRVL